MRYEKLPSSLFIKNREKFIAKMKNNSIALFCSNEWMPSNGDGQMGFQQNSSLFYLSGIDQADTYLLICKTKKGSFYNLYIQKTSEYLKTWEGEKLSKEEAAEISGIEKIKWNKNFEKDFHKLLKEYKTVYFHISQDKSQYYNLENRTFRHYQKRIKNHKALFSNNLIDTLRACKEPEEIELIKKAINITNEGYLALANSLKPGIMEFQLEAVLTYTFIENRSRYHAFSPIIASGKNATILHYVNNNAECKKGDLVLCDFGAEYANYKGDITRVLPVSGKFNKRQAAIYNAVQNILEQAIQVYTIGNSIEKIKSLEADWYNPVLIKLGLLTQEEIEKNPQAYKRYMPHGIAHFLGLDTHDVGKRNWEFKAGMVLTCEPGIYIQEEGIGIRLENDILITEQGPINLSADIPIGVKETELLMKPA